MLSNIGNTFCCISPLQKHTVIIYRKLLFSNIIILLLCYKTHIIQHYKKKTYVLTMSLASPVGDWAQGIPKKTETLNLYLSTLATPGLSNSGTLGPSYKYTQYPFTRPQLVFTVTSLCKFSHPGRHSPGKKIDFSQINFKYFHSTKLSK